MSETNKISQIADELRTLSIQDKATMKSILDGLLLEERKSLAYSNYTELMLELLVTRPTYTTDIALLETELTRSRD